MEGTYRGLRVLVTGHTGFKGSWLALWLRALGAEVAGVALGPPTQPSHFGLCRTGEGIDDIRADIRDYERLLAVMAEARPALVFHLAAQPLVRRAYDQPRETFETNVMGTVNVLEAARRTGSVRAIVVATTDKVYRDEGGGAAYREDDRLGGHEPYSGSKACAELAAAVYADRRFQQHAAAPRRFAVATARAGNVIGGGDYAANRLIPDLVRAILAGREVVIRNPLAIRPWQHVLDCLAGYLQLGACLLHEPGRFARPWNIGPQEDALPVGDIAAAILARWPGHRTAMRIARDPEGKEAPLLRLDPTKAISELGWQPCWSAAAALDATVDWYRAASGESGADMRAVSFAQIAVFGTAARAAGMAWCTP